MTNETTEPQVEQTTMRWLPWPLAAGAAVLYLLTLNHWVTLTSLPYVARLTGWDWHPANLEWRPSFLEPLYMLLTLPFRSLPSAIRPIAMNLFSAVLGVATLWELARTVKLMPQNRTKAQRQRSQNSYGVLVGKLCWIPATISVLLLGMEQVFWQNSTQASGEMLSLYIFAFCFRSVMEFRVTESDRWLYALALAHGLGVANNWAMIAYFPLFLASVIWVKGVTFFNARFLVKMLIFGLAGLSLYLLVPVFDRMYGEPGAPYWESLRQYLRFQKTFLADLPFLRVGSFRAHLFVILLTSLLPLLLACIRWSSPAGDFNPAASATIGVIFKLVHIFFLAMGAWLFFDPPFSPREIGMKMMPFLSNYYMAALTVGYLTGYVIIVFGVEPTVSWQRASGPARFVNKLMVFVVTLAAVTLPVALCWKNLPGMLASRSDLLSKLGAVLSEEIPTSHTVILSDDPVELMFYQAACEREGKPMQNLLLDTQCLPYPRYHRYLYDQYPQFHNSLFATNLPAQNVPERILLQYLIHLSASNHIYYLHPSFGYFFEAFYPRPHGLAVELKRYTKESLLAPKLTPPEIEENENFWHAQNDKLVAQILSEARFGGDALAVGQVISRSLDNWGVELQRLNDRDQFGSAGEHFSKALELFPENLASKISLQFNGLLKQGKIQPIATDQEIERKLGKFGDSDEVVLQQAISSFGPFDELRFDYRLGEVFGQRHNLRQAAELFQHLIDLQPEAVLPRIALAKTLIDMKLPARAVQTVQSMETLDPAVIGRSNYVEVLRVKSYALAQDGKFDEGEKLLLKTLDHDPADIQTLGLVCQYYLLTQKFTNAMTLLDKIIQLQPDNGWAILNKSKLLFEEKRYPEVITMVNRFTALEGNIFEPLIYRAVSYLETGDLTRSKKDYQELLQKAPEPYFWIYYGLGEIAYREKDTSTALKNYQKYIELAPVNTDEFKEVKKRYEALKSGH